ncbi:MAG: DUF692 domain-containing protein [Gammaproteobacteria bacterium]|nr:DUF692 domain-containing protein [Gammaproteobacteria bacterium]
MQRESVPYLGFGLRLRKEYLQQVLEQKPDVDWFEIISENYLGAPDEALAPLLQIRDTYPVVMHGISLAIGSPWPLDMDYLTRMRRLIDRLQPAWISDHLCWSGADDMQGRMLPLPYSEEALDHIVPRIEQVQEFLGRQLLLENVPMDANETEPEIPEAEFLRLVAERSDSLILLDAANLHASSVNQGFDPLKYLWKLPAERVRQIHLSGAIVLCGSSESSDGYAEDPLWSLYSSALQRFGPVSTMIERMDTLAPFEEMVSELRKARCRAEGLIASR